MKKLFLIILFILASITCFGQYTLVFSIKTDSTAFPRILPSNSLVFVIDSINETYDGVSLFKTLSIIQKDSSLRSIAHIKTNAYYSKLTDSLHLYQEFGIDTIKSSGNTVVNNGLVIKDYLMPLHKGAAGKVLTMSATGDSLFWGGSSIAVDTASYSYIADNANYLQGLDTTNLLNRYWNRTNDSIITNYKTIVNNNFSSIGSFSNINGNQGFMNDTNYFGTGAKALGHITNKNFFVNPTDSAYYNVYIKGTLGVYTIDREQMAYHQRLNGQEKILAYVFAERTKSTIGFYDSLGATHGNEAIFSNNGVGFKALNRDINETTLMIDADGLIYLNDYSMPRHKGFAGKVLTMSATGDSATWATLNGFDSTHCWQKIKTDSIESCSPLVLTSNDSIVYNAPKHKFDNIIYSNGINNIGSITTTNGNFYGKSANRFCGIDTTYEGILKVIGVGKIDGLVLSGNYTLNGALYLENINANVFGFERKVSNIIQTSSSIVADSLELQLFHFVDGKKIRLAMSDTGFVIGMPSKTIMSADSGANHLKIYVPTIVKSNLTVNGTITSGGLINKDTVITLVDDGVFNFPTTSVGWAEIQCDSSLIEKTWGNVSWNGDGATNLRSKGEKFANTDIDGNYACFYDGGNYAILKNTSGYTQTYSIKYHYHY